MKSILREDWFFWAVVLAAAFPIATIALGQVVTALRRAGHPLEPVARLSLNILLPLVVVFLFLQQVVQLEAASTTVRLTLTLALLAALYMALAFLNAIVFGRASPDSWRGRTPKLLRDLIMVLLVAIGAVGLMAAVWDRDVAGLFAALGVGSIVLGLALQETLGNVMLGISLLMERPFSEGDWIEIGSLEGRVSEINWRAIRLIDRGGDEIIVPHATAASETIINSSHPTTVDRVSVTLGFGYEHPPNRVKAVLLETAAATDGVLAEPAPQVQTIEYGDFSVNYLVHFHVAHPAKKVRVRDAFMTRVWYAAQRAGLNIPFPIRTLYHHRGERGSEPERRALEQAQRSSVLREALSSEDLDRFAQGSQFKHFAGGETLIEQGSVEPLLYLIVAGQATITTRKGGEEYRLYELSYGDVAGEITVFSAAPSPYSVTAKNDLETLELRSEVAHRLVENKPGLAIELAQIMDRRRRAVASAGA